MGAPLSISFEGAARTVTGSRHHLSFGDKQWLLDCGIYQGHREEADLVNRSFALEPSRMDAVVLSHAHLDHAGNLPTLVHQGFRGPIHATAPTTELCRVMLADSAFLMNKDFEHARKREKERGATDGKRAALEPLYDVEDVGATMERFVSRGYHEPWELFPGVTVEFHDAGHILGSALTTFEFRSGSETYRLGMSGDLGRPDRPILRDPETHPGVDALVLESTYGDRLHPGPGETERRLAELVTATAARGGRVLVPAFAVGRAQELVATLHHLMTAGTIPELPMFVDSPLAGQTTEVFKNHPEVFDEATRVAFTERNGEPFGFARLRYTRTPDESRALNDFDQRCIIIAASGMCEGGRILHHLRNGLGDAKNLVLFVGFQAEGTLGRRIVDGAEFVSIFGEPVRRRAEVQSLAGFSAHADQRELVEWVARLTPAPRRIFLVHGDFAPAAVLAEKLTERVGAEVRIPARGERYTLWN